MVQGWQKYQRKEQLVNLWKYSELVVPEFLLSVLYGISCFSQMLSRENLLYIWFRDSFGVIPYSIKEKSEKMLKRPNYLTVLVVLKVMIRQIDGVYRLDHV